jgi:hypothetical protein
MPATLTRSSSLLRICALLAVALVLVLAVLTGLLAVMIRPGACTGATDGTSPSSAARDGIPADYLSLYREAGRAYGVPWPVLAGIGAIETDHGRSGAPGVRSGRNSFGCCAGPMQFNITDGPPSTWDRYAVDGNHDGHRDVYDPADAIASAGNYLRALLRAAGGEIRQAILGYNRSQAYVNDVLARAEAYSTDDASTITVELAADEGACTTGGVDIPVGPANLRDARRIASPRAYRTLPNWAMAAGHGPEPVDARLYDDIVWILRRYHLRVSAARESGHHTHGDGTAVDLIPADGTNQPVWDASAGRLAHDLGWTSECAASGSRPACPLAPAIQFIGYDGYPGHGSPRTCNAGCPAHIHISWTSPCYGTSALSPPCQWVTAFAAPAPEDDASFTRAANHRTDRRDA